MLHLALPSTLVLALSVTACWRIGYEGIDSTDSDIRSGDSDDTATGDSGGASGSDLDSRDRLDITVSGLTAVATGGYAFRASFDFNGDANANAVASLYYCNATTTPGCDPSTGQSLSMLRGWYVYSVAFESQVSGFIPGDTLNLEAVVVDADGVIGSPLAGTVSLVPAISIYRSVGPGATTALAAGSGTLTVLGSTATFSVALPDNVGVGDVIQYDADNDSTVDSLAFISARASATVFGVGTATGLPNPTATAVADSDWEIYRAYTSLFDLTHGAENSSLEPTLADFDTVEIYSSPDLVATNSRMRIACYDGGAVIDDDGLASFAGWTTGPANYIHIYTPTAANEVGTSQRHRGTWGSLGYRRSDDIYADTNYMRIDGISFKGVMERAVFIHDIRGLSEIRISNCFVHCTATDYTPMIDIYNNEGPVVVKAWNTIIINDSTDGSSYAFYGNSENVRTYISNCTAVMNNGNAYHQWSWSTGMVVKNSIAYVRGSGTGFYGLDDPSSSVDNCVSTDDTATQFGGVGNLANQNMGASFVALPPAADPDLHLAAGDTVATGIGANLTTDTDTPFTTDIDGNNRPATGAWDIGADEH